MAAFCVNCGRAYEESDNFCNHCGKPLPKAAIVSSQITPARDNGEQHVVSAPLIYQEDISSAAQAEPKQEIETPRFTSTQSAPLARFTLFSSLVVLLAAAVALLIFDALYRGESSLLPFAFLLLLACAILIWFSHKTWSAIPLYGAPNLVPLQFRRKLIIRLAIFAALALAGAALIGAQIGLSGAATKSYLSDLALYKELGSKISATRNAAPETIGGQISMYAEIEPEVRSLDTVVARLKRENQEYSTRYPAAHTATLQSAAALDETSKRGELLLQQIAVAKQIRELQPHEAQVALYREKMLPLLQEEDHLDGR